MVAASRHPLLMEDGVARDVLWWLADLAHDRNGGRIMAALDKLAETLERSGSQVRRAVDRLEAAGLLIDTGERVGGRRVVVWTVREEVLKNHTFTRDLTPEPEREIPDVPSSRSRRDLVAHGRRQT